MQTIQIKVSREFNCPTAMKKCIILHKKMLETGSNIQYTISKDQHKLTPIISKISKLILLSLKLKRSAIPLLLVQRRGRNSKKLFIKAKSAALWRKTEITIVRGSYQNVLEFLAFITDASSFLIRATFYCFVLLWIRNIIAKSELALYI